MRTLFIAILLLAVPGESLSATGLDAGEWFMKGNQLSQAGHFEEAAIAYQESIKLNASSPVAHYNLGIAYKNLHRDEHAAKAFAKTIELEPMHLDAHLSLGNVYNRMERWQDAIGALNMVVHRRQNDAEAHGNLGWAYYNYQDGPPFKYLVIINLQKAVDLFKEQSMQGAADATRRLLEEARIKFGFLSEN